jgi:hypothetical protein
MPKRHSDSPDTDQHRHTAARHGTRSGCRVDLTVWVRRDCVLWDRGPYHWTAECIEGRALGPLSREQAEAMSNLRPCKMCAGRDRRRGHRR